MAQRMQGLAGVLKNGIVGRYKGGFPAASRVGACVIAVPWEANPTALHAYRPPPPRGSTAADAAATNAQRPLLVHFAGALDVCCTGQHIRCAMGPLAAAAADQQDVLMKCKCLGSLEVVGEEGRGSGSRRCSLSLSLSLSHTHTHAHKLETWTELSFL